MAKTWILVADAGHAVMLATSGSVEHAVELRRLENAAATGPAQQHKESGGAAYGSHMQSYEPRSTPAEHALEAFARTLIDTLERGRIEGAFEQLIMVAPARMLGALRGLMSPPLQRTVAREVTRDLVRETTPALKAHLQRLLA